MALSKIHVSLEGLSDLLFGFKHNIRVTDIRVDQETKIAYFTVEGNDVPDAPRIYIDYGAFYGKAIGENNPYTGDGSDLVREVRLVTIREQN
jgi:hypothetical protein